MINIRPSVTKFCCFFSRLCCNLSFSLASYWIISSLKIVQIKQIEKKNILWSWLFTCSACDEGLQTDTVLFQSGHKLERFGITASSPSWGCSFVICSPHGSFLTLQEDSAQGSAEPQRASSSVRHSADSRWWRAVLTRGEARGHPRTWVRAPAGVTSGHHLRLPLTVTAVPPRGIVGDMACCQLRLYSPEKGGRVTFDLRCHLLMEVSGKKEPSLLLKLCYNPHLTCSYEMTSPVK